MGCIVRTESMFDPCGSRAECSGRSQGSVGAQSARDGAFDDLFLRDFDRCMGIARRIVGEKELARDLAMEAFTRAWTRWALLRDQQPRAWVVKVTANLAVDAMRK